VRWPNAWRRRVTRPSSWFPAFGAPVRIGSIVSSLLEPVALYARAPIGDPSSTEVKRFFPLLPLRGGPLGPRLRRCLFQEDRTAPYCGASGFPLLPLRGGPLGPRLRRCLFQEDRTAPYCGASGFPLLPLRGRPLGPRLRKGSRRHRPDRAVFCGASGSGSRKHCYQEIAAFVRYPENNPSSVNRVMTERHGRRPQPWKHDAAGRLPRVARSHRVVPHRHGFVFGFPNCTASELDEQPGLRDPTDF